MSAEVERRAPGWCQVCDVAVAAGLVVAEEHGNSGPGRTAVVCAAHERTPLPKRPGAASPLPVRGRMRRSHGL